MKGQAATVNSMQEGIHAVVSEQKRDLAKVRVEVAEYVQNAMAGA